MSATAFGRVVRREGRVLPLADSAYELAKLLSCASASIKSRNRSFETSSFETSSLLSICVSIITGSESRRLQQNKIERNRKHPSLQND